MATTRLTDNQPQLHINGELDVAANFGVGQSASRIKVLWDLDGDGDFDEPEEDITEFVLSCSTVSGRDNASQLLGQVSPGKLQALLDNSDGRFGYFNSASPLLAAPFNMRSSHLMRVQTDDTPLTGIDPELIAVDTFDVDGQLTYTQNAVSWNDAASCRKDSGVLSSTAELARPWIETGQNDCYIQVQLAQLHHSSVLGVTYRRQSDGRSGLIYLTMSQSLNCVHYRLNANGSIASVLSGTINLGEGIDGRYIGVEVTGSTVNIFVDGVKVHFFGVAFNLGSGVGLYFSGDHQPRSFGEFGVWDSRPKIHEGVLWTGRVSSAHPSKSSNGQETVALKAEGPLSIAAIAEIKTLDSVGVGLISSGLYAGQYAANSLLKAGLPLAEVDTDILIGSTGDDTVSALTAARAAEKTELGRLTETPEGRIKFTSRSDVPTRAVSSWSDSESGHFSAESLTLNNWRSEKRNRVTAAVSPELPTLRGVRTYTTNANHSVLVDADIPASFWSETFASNYSAGSTPLNPGDLIIWTVVHTIGKPNDSWRVPSGWREIRNNTQNEPGATKVYGHIVTADDLTITAPIQLNDNLANSSGDSGGVTLQAGYVFEGFHGSLAEGLHVSAEGFQSPAMTAAARRGVLTHPGVGPPWGAEPTRHIYMQAGTNTSGANPEFDVGILASELPYQTRLGGSYSADSVIGPEYDCGYMRAFRELSTSDSEPWRFTKTMEGYSNLEVLDIMIRGYTGAGIDKKRLEVITDDLDSQAQSGGVLSYQLKGGSFPDVDAAIEHNRVVLANYSDDNPTLKMTFTASKSEAHRMQAIRNRLGTVINVADSTLGISGFYSIESVAHSWSNGRTLWTVQWGLSPI